MSDHAKRFFVVTGGPGAGKSSLIEALRGAGYARTIEAGRAIIQDQVAIGGNAVPWRDPILFAELMLDWELRSYHLAEQTSGPVFFDRGVVDLIGYFEVIQRPVPGYLKRAAETYRYNSRVFVAPPWEEIFEQDRERKQDFAESVRTHEALVSAYQENGYELMELPRVSVEQRLRFVLERIGLAARGVTFQ